MISVYKPSIIIFLCFLHLISIPGFGQNKYAVLVGVNDYYESPTVKSFHSLKGCVNDALSMKSLLINRFGFDKTNINLILNEKATQNNLINVMAATLTKSNAGDVVLFFFSGHGIYIDNVALNQDPIKKGYNQSLIMSDLYSPGYACLVKDNTLKKVFNQFVAKKVILTTIFDCCYSGNMSMTISSQLMQHNPYVNDAINDTTSLKSIYIDDLDRMSRAVNMTVMPVITDKEIVPRPSETKNSNFAAISACKDDEKASEIWDESGVPHGALTKAILSTYEKSKLDVPLLKLLTKITTEININQHFRQKPTFHYDGLRNLNNLIGLPLQTTIKPLSAICIGVKTASITLNVGYNDGFAIGNVLINKGNKVTISKITRDSASATFATGHQVKTGDVFILKDHFRLSSPILKIYIALANVSVSSYMSYVNREMLPLSKQKNYIDYFNWYNDPDSPTFLSSISIGERNKISAYAKNQNFAVLLPLPKDMAASIKHFFRKDQSIAFVNIQKDADKVLYLNYAVKSKNNQNPCFVITYRDGLNGFVDQDIYKFSTFFVKLNQITLNPSAMASMNNSLKTITYNLARTRGSNWFNSYTKR